MSRALLSFRRIGGAGWRCVGVVSGRYVGGSVGGGVGGGVGSGVGGGDGNIVGRCVGVGRRAWAVGRAWGVHGASLGRVGQ